MSTATADIIEAINEQGIVFAFDTAQYAGMDADDPQFNEYRWAVAKAFDQLGVERYDTAADDSHMVKVIQRIVAEVSGLDPDNSADKAEIVDKTTDVFDAVLNGIDLQS